jgi:autophagy-related protein 9
MQEKPYSYENENYQQTKNNYVVYDKSHQPNIHDDRVMFLYDNNYSNNDDICYHRIEGETEEEEENTGTSLLRHDYTNHKRSLLQPPSKQTAGGFSTQPQHNINNFTPSASSLGITNLNQNNLSHHANLRSSNKHQHQLPENNPNSNFVLLDRFRLRPKKEGWRAVANLDIFFASIYNFYYHRGLIPLIGKGVVELISLFFTLWLSIFLFVYLDWESLSQCRDETTCRPTLSHYIIEKPFAEASLYNFLVVIYLILFTVYGFFATMSFVTTVRTAFDSKYFFEEKLGYSAEKLEGGAVDWDEIVEKIVNLQQSGEHRVAIHGQKIDALVIAQRILRRENFMIAFFNRKMLNLTVPTPQFSGISSMFESKMFFSKSLEWSIYFCILSYMFNHKYQIRPAFYLHPESLKRRLRLCGIAHAIFMPFLIVFVTLHFFMQNIYDWRSTKQYLGPNEWSSIAKWTFREFNELPHAFERRLGPSYRASEDYLKLFPKSSITSSLGRVLVFISGSLGAVLLGLAAINDSILLHIKIGQWNLVWYVGILGVLYSIGKGMIPDTSIHPSYTFNLFSAMDSALAEVASYTHHYPETWKKRGWDKITKSAFSELFQAKAKLFLLEILSIIFAPIILCVSLPQNASEICAFIHGVKIEVPGAGEVCGFSTFDFDTFQDENWHGKTMGSKSKSFDIDRSQLKKQTIGASSMSNIYHNGIPMAHDGKMEKSFFNFKTIHPHWKCDSSGQQLIERIENYRSEQAIALARERHQHLEAAERQLDTLRKLESKQESKAHLKNVNENYIGQREMNKNFKTLDGYNSSNAILLQNNNVDMENLDLRKKADKTVPTQRLNPSHPVESSVLHYTDLRLSSELQKVLSRSLLDYDASFYQSNVLGNQLPNHLSTSVSSVKSATDQDRNVQYQYLLLEKYHSSLNQPP